MITAEDAAGESIWLSIMDTTGTQKQQYVNDAFPVWCRGKSCVRLEIPSDHVGWGCESQDGMTWRPHWKMSKCPGYKGKKHGNNTRN